MEHSPPCTYTQRHAHLQAPAHGQGPTKTEAYLPSSALLRSDFDNLHLCERSRMSLIEAPPPSPSCWNMSVSLTSWPAPDVEGCGNLLCNGWLFPPVEHGSGLGEEQAFRSLLYLALQFCA
eukprot:RCo047652